MVEAIIALIAGIVTLVGMVLAAKKDKRNNQNAMGQSDDRTLRDSMDAVDRATGVQPPEGKA